MNHVSPSSPGSCGSKSGQCAPSVNGCLKCESIPTGEILAQTSAILFGARDSDACSALQAVMAQSGFRCEPFGPLLIARDVQNRLDVLADLVTEKLSLYTQSCIQATYCPAGLKTINDALAAMVFASPLCDMIENIEHEWVRTALNENWLFAVFHPIISARTGGIYAHEALLRARNPRETQVIGAFPIITACERLNLLHQLDQRARRLAIGAAAAHLPTSSRIFINFLPNTIYDPEICLRTTMEAAALHNIPLDRLVFEVVETEQIPDMENLCKILDYYKARGASTAIDDMGAGFAKIDYIQALKPAFVKLDREFMLTAEATTEGRQLMSTMIRTSHDNEAKVIAEGIETVAQMKMCVDSGVDFLQGFLFGKPACPPLPVQVRKDQREAA